MAKNLLINLLTIVASTNALAAGSADATALASDNSDKQNKAFQVSPQDKVYDKHQIDAEDKFHAPSAPPSDRQAVVDDQGNEDTKSSKTAHAEKEKEKEKGSKGSIILADYDSSRLGVSADEAKSGTKLEEKREKPIAKEKVLATESKPVLKSSEDVAHAVNDNKGAAVKNTVLPEGAATTTTTKTYTAVKKDTLPTILTSATNVVTAPTSVAKELVREEKIVEKDTKKPGSTVAADAAGPEVEPTRLSRFVGAAAMIIVSELGDKTFFIAALMAMRHNPWFVFTSSYLAMVVMTVMSMVLGLVLPTLLSRRVTTLLAAVLFLFFAIKMLCEAWGMDPNLLATEELEEVEHDLAMDDRDAANEKVEGGGMASDKRKSSGISNLASLVLSPVWIQIFTMTFLAEWGDRSQIATVAMGVGEGFVPVLIGCLLGHFTTTLIAIMGGKILATRLSLRTITFSGAVCFLLFGAFNFGDWISQN